MRVFNDCAEIVVQARVTPAVQPGQLIMYNGFEPYQFKSWRDFSHVEPGMVKWLHLAGGYGHLRYRASCTGSRSRSTARYGPTSRASTPELVQTAPIGAFNTCVGAGVREIPTFISRKGRGPSGTQTLGPRVRNTLLPGAVRYSLRRGEYSPYAALA
jgi:hypothetical protein